MGDWKKMVEEIKSLPFAGEVNVYLPNEVNPIPEAKLNEKMLSALRSPEGSPPLKELVKEGMKVLICVSDKTRIFPKSEMIKAVLQEISPPLKNKDVIFAVAGGNHAPSTPEESGITSDLIEGYTWYSHTSTGGNYVLAGKTRARLGLYPLVFFLKDFFMFLSSLPSTVWQVAGDILRGRWSRLKHHFGLGPWGRALLVLRASFSTPVYVDAVAKGVDLIITIGQIKPHYFAGFSGGAKSILPGIATRDTIVSNHMMRPHPRAVLGVARDNPIREDMEEAAKLVGNVFIFNVVLDGEGRPYAFVAGDVVKAHKKGAKKALEVGLVRAEEHDVVITVGEPPLDMNLYQFTKAIAPALKFAGKNSAIIAVGECREGVGGRFIVNEIIYKLGFMPREPRGIRYYLVSSLPEKEVLATFLEPAPSVKDALEREYKRKGRKLKIAVLPHPGPLAPYRPEENPEEWI